LSTGDTPEKAEVYRGCLPPHPAAGPFFHSLLAVRGKSSLIFFHDVARRNRQGFPGVIAAASSPSGHAPQPAKIVPFSTLQQSDAIHHGE
jgi:hypothetical protein